MCLHWIKENILVFVIFAQTTQNPMTFVKKKMYVKDCKHIDLSTKGKMSVAMFEEMQSEETTISSNGDRVSDLVREDNI